jgi:hypothetical protein
LHSPTRKRGDEREKKERKRKDKRQIREITTKEIRKKTKGMKYRANEVLAGWKHWKRLQFSYRPLCSDFGIPAVDFQIHLSQQSS